MEKASELVSGRAFDLAVPLSFNQKATDGRRRTFESYRRAEIPEAFWARTEVPAQITKS